MRVHTTRNRRDRRAGHQNGYLLLVTLVFFSALFVLSAAFVQSTVVYTKFERNAVAKAQALALAEAGIDKAVYELNQSASYTGESDTALGPGTFTISVSSIDGNTKAITATGYVPNDSSPLASQTARATVAINSDTASFRFGVQVGVGGLVMDNNSQINGSIFSNGNVSGSGIITGDANVAAGVTTSLSGVEVQGNATSTSMTGCTVGGKAYYQTTNTCDVGGSSLQGNDISAPQPMPISDSQIADWKDAAAGGVQGDTTINGTVSLGPRHITGSLTVNGTLNLTGPVWVTGSITVNNNAVIRVGAAIGNASVALITDSTVAFSNNVIVAGNGNPGSFVLVLSTSASTSAIDLGNNVTGGIYYTSTGTIDVSNNAAAAQLTGYAIHLNNNAVVTYTSGLQSLMFSSGPGGSWAFVPGTYVIVE